MRREREWGGELHQGGRKARHLRVQRNLFGEWGKWIMEDFEARESLEIEEYGISHAIYLTTSQAKPDLRKKTRGEVTLRRKKLAFFTSPRRRCLYHNTTFAIECSFFC